MRATWHRLCIWRRTAGLLAVAAWLACGEAAADPLRLIDETHSMRSAGARSRLARELAHDINIVLKRIGAPAPEESAAVMEELGAIGRLGDPRAVHTRAQRLHASAPFQYLRLGNTLAAVPTRSIAPLRPTGRYGAR